MSAADCSRCEEVKHTSMFHVPESKPSTAIVYNLTAREAESDKVFAAFVMLCDVVYASVHV